MENRVSREKIRDNMGKTTCFKIKDNEKTVMMLDKKILVAKMANLKSLTETRKEEHGIISKAISYFRKPSKG